VNRSEESIYEQVASLHATSINQGFLTKLGVPFLSILYQAIDNDENSVLIVRSENRRVVGFISGTKNISSVYRNLIRYLPRIIIALAPKLKSRENLAKIVELIKLGRDNTLSELPKAELLSLAVLPGERTKGYASSLYRELRSWFRENNCDEFRIVVGITLEPARAFYQHMGAKSVGEFDVHKGDRSIIYCDSSSAR
jgi:ribosomal protein S18 acetylase RimI-like enzyme